MNSINVKDRGVLEANLQQDISSSSDGVSGYSSTSHYGFRDQDLIIPGDNFWYLAVKTVMKINLLDFEAKLLMVDSS